MAKLILGTKKKQAGQHQGHYPTKTAPAAGQAPVQQHGKIMDEARVEELLSEKLMDGFLLLERACPQCITPLVKQEQALHSAAKTQDMRSPIPGVPYCVSCQAHVMNDERDIVRLQKHFHGQPLQGNILVDLERDVVKQASLADDATVGTEASSENESEGDHHNQEKNVIVAGVTVQEPHPNSFIADEEEIELICSHMSSDDNDNTISDTMSENESTVASVVQGFTDSHDHETLDSQPNKNGKFSVNARGLMVDTTAPSPGFKSHADSAQAEDSSADAGLPGRGDDHWPSFEERKMIATKVLSVKMLQGHRLLQKQCRKCSMPMTEYQGESDCVVCPVLHWRILKAREKERQQQLELERSIAEQKNVVQKKKNMLLESAKPRPSSLAVVEDLPNSESDDSFSQNSFGRGVDPPSADEADVKEEEQKQEDQPKPSEEKANINDQPVEYTETIVQPVGETVVVQANPDAVVVHNTNYYVIPAAGMMGQNHDVGTSAVAKKDESNDSAQIRKPFASSENSSDIDPPTENGRDGAAPPGASDGNNQTSPKSPNNVMGTEEGNDQTATENSNNVITMEEGDMSMNEHNKSMKDGNDQKTANDETSPESPTNVHATKDVSDEAAPNSPTNIADTKSGNDEAVGTSPRNEGQKEENKTIEPKNNQNEDKRDEIVQQLQAQNNNNNNNNNNNTMITNRRENVLTGCAGAAAKIGMSSGVSLLSRAGSRPGELPKRIVRARGVGSQQIAKPFLKKNAFRNSVAEMKKKKKGEEQTRDSAKGRAARPVMGIVKVTLQPETEEEKPKKNVEETKTTNNQDDEEHLSLPCNSTISTKTKSEKGVENNDTEAFAVDESPADENAPEKANELVDEFQPEPEPAYDERAFVFDEPALMDPPESDPNLDSTFEDKKKVTSNEIEKWMAVGWIPLNVPCATCAMPLMVDSLGENETCVYCNLQQKEEDTGDAQQDDPNPKTEPEPKVLEPVDTGRRSARDMWSAISRSRNVQNANVQSTSDPPAVQGYTLRRRNAKDCEESMGANIYRPWVVQEEVKEVPKKQDPSSVLQDAMENPKKRDPSIDGSDDLIERQPSLDPLDISGESKEKKQPSLDPLDTIGESKEKKPPSLDPLDTSLKSKEKKQPSLDPLESFDESKVKKQSSLDPLDSFDESKDKQRETHLEHDAVMEAEKHGDFGNSVEQSGSPSLPNAREPPSRNQAKELPLPPKAKGPSPEDFAVGRVAARPKVTVNPDEEIEQSGEIEPTLNLASPLSVVAVRNSSQEVPHDATVEIEDLTLGIPPSFDVNNEVALRQLIAAAKLGVSLSIDTSDDEEDDSHHVERVASPGNSEAAMPSHYSVKVSASVDSAEPNRPNWEPGEIQSRFSSKASASHSNQSSRMRSAMSVTSGLSSIAPQSHVASYISQKSTASSNNEDYGRSLGKVPSREVSIGSSYVTPIVISSQSSRERNERKESKKNYMILTENSSSVSPETIIILDDGDDSLSRAESTSSGHQSVSSEAIDELLSKIEQTQAELAAAGNQEDSIEKREKLAELLDQLSAAAAAVEELDDDGYTTQTEESLSFPQLVGTVQPKSTWGKKR